MYLNRTDNINAVFASVPFDNQYSKLGRIAWTNSTLLNTGKTYVRYQRSTKKNYPPDTNPYNDNYTYMPIGASIHDVQYMHDFANYY